MCIERETSGWDALNIGSQLTFRQLVLETEEGPVLLLGGFVQELLLLDEALGVSAMSSVSLTTSAETMTIRWV